VMNQPEAMDFAPKTQGLDVLSSLTVKAERYSLTT
jgi:hypothetical protein